MLRDYQQAAFERLRNAVRNGSRSPLLVMPTGSGKTHVAKAIIESAASKGDVLFLAPRRELVYQLCEKLEAAGIDYGVLMAGEEMSLLSKVQVASVATLHARCMRSSRIPLPSARVIVIDEAHISITPATKELLSHYPNVVKIGMTATPCRLDGRGLGEIYDAMVMGPTIAELTRLGHLVPPHYYAPSVPDLAGVRIVAGDYHEGQLADRMDQPKIVGDVISNWARIASERITLVGAVNIAHAKHLRDQFAAIGVQAEHVDSDTSTQERKDILQRLAAGTTRIVTFVDVCTYGVDIPPVSCAVNARPTKSLTRYLQFIGRVLRPYPGKKDCLVLDHGGCLDQHGFVDEEREWTLDGVQRRERNASEYRPSERKTVTCPKCAYVFYAQAQCPACGHEISFKRGKDIETEEADLHEVTRQKKRINREKSPEEKAQFYAELKGYAEERGYHEGWASHKYKERFGVWPNAHKWVTAQPPGPETRAYIRHLQIRWAKRKEKERATA